MNEKEKAGNGQGNETKHGIIKISTGGVFDSIDILGEAIKALGQKYNILVPGGAVGGKLPLLHAAAMSFVFVDPEKETYAIPGKADRGISKMALDRIAAAAGVRWNPHLCGRVDDSSNPHVVEYQAAGTVLQLDGTERMIHASKRVDLRAEKGTPESTWGSDSQEFARSAADKNPPGDPWPRILQARQHILSLAESKAKNRAIRSLGVRTAYAPADLAKGFVVLRLQFTGRSDDPEVEREVSLMIARRALNSQSALYGGRELPPGPIAKVPKIAVKETEVEEEENGNGTKAPETAKPQPAAAAPAPEPAKASPAAERKCPADDPLLICGDQDEKGNWPRKPCSEFPIEMLKAKIFAAEKKRPTWDKKWAAKIEAELLAMKAWLAFKEFDPRQGTLPCVDPKSDEVSF